MKSNVEKRKAATSFDNQFHGYQYEAKLMQGDYYVHGRTMSIAGSHTARDWLDDFTKVPAWGDLRNSERYQKVRTKFEEQEQIDTVVGHSLGGSVSLKLEKNYPDRKLKSRTYGAPVMDLLGSKDEKG